MVTGEVGMLLVLVVGYRQRGSLDWLQGSCGTCKEHLKTGRMQKRLGFVNVCGVVNQST